MSHFVFFSEEGSGYFQFLAVYRCPTSVRKICRFDRLTTANLFHSADEICSWALTFCRTGVNEVSLSGSLSTNVPKHFILDTVISKRVKSGDIYLSEKVSDK